MKKYVMLILFTAAAVSWILIFPLLGAISVPKYTGIRAAYTYRNDSISCSGTIQASRQQVITFGYYIEPEKVYVHEGETVKQGEKLMDIDRNATMEAFKTITATGQMDNSTDSSSSDIGDNVDTASSNTAAYFAGAGSSSSNSMSSSELNELINQYATANGTSSLSGSSGVSQSDSEADQTAASAGSDGPSDLQQTCYAGISGTVTEIEAQEGAFAKPTTPLFVISDPSSYQVIAQVDENNIKNVSVGSSVEITGNALNKTYHGTVTGIASSAESVLTENGTKTVLDVTINITDKDSYLKPGFSVNAAISEKSSGKSIVVPYEAVGEDDRNIQYVFVCDNGRAFRKNITTGKEYSNTLEISSGLQGGDIVLLNPSKNLKNGQHIKVTLKEGKA